MPASRFSIRAETNKNGPKEGYIDRQGCVVIEPQFESAGVFSEGRAHVRLGGLFGYIDATGQVVVPARFSFAYPYSEGLAGVGFCDGGMGFIDVNGEIIIAPQHRETLPFREARAAVRVGESWGYIDPTGAEVINYQ